MSVVLRPTVATELMGMMTLVVADGLVRWFRELGVAATVKWPNDVLGPDNKKLCGILAQWLPETNAVVIGVGTNLQLSEVTRLEQAGALGDYGVQFDAQDYVIAARQYMLQAVDVFVANPQVQALEPTMATIGQRVKAIMPDGNDVFGMAVGLGATGSL